MGLQLVFQFLVIRNLARPLPDLAGVVVGDIPELAGTPPMTVKRLCNLRMVTDFRSVGAVDFQHPERLYNCF
ncbi:MAG: hypothetical protein J07HQW2_03631 [Haloquadratum walsbyi J07HQW2]|uniref:Uncharacterized protein n=1 Tax=Haloquadratum walsbyi J07HQW2 TaxID=1238425 RepID=U1NIT8_9EURY|nr:MAG: hypothetical protein J07HQW2_03631 [Haloquadratum walsbyi J07HQW2]